MRKKIVSFVWFVSFWSKSGFGVRVTNNKCHPSVCLGRHAMLHYLALRDDSNNGLETLRVGNCGLLFKSFRLFRTFSGRWSQNFLTIHIMTEILGIFG